MKRIRTFALILPLAVVSACTYEVSGPDYAENAVLRVTVTGGIQPASFRYQVDTRGDVTGVACEAGCDFEPGEVIHHMTPAQRAAVLDAINESGLPTAGRPTDFGTECCDQQTFSIIYESGSEVRSFSGSLDAFPTPLRELVRLVDLLYRSTPPVILSQTAGLTGFPVDALDLERAALDGDILEVDLTFGGGCGIHDVDAVVSTAFMESDPVQVGVALAHDAHNDACDALLQPTLHFNLTPLRAAYTSAYDREHGTIRLSLAPGTAQSTSDPHVLEYTF